MRTFLQERNIDYTKTKGPFWLLEAYFTTKVIKHFRVYSWIYTSMMKWNCQGSVISSVLSHHNRNLKLWTLKPLAHHNSRTVHVMSFQSRSVYLENKGMPTQKAWREQPERETMSMCEREAPAPYYLSCSPPGPALCVNWS